MIYKIGNQVMPHLAVMSYIGGVTQISDLSFPYLIYYFSHKIKEMLARLFNSL